MDLCNSEFGLGWHIFSQITLLRNQTEFIFAVLNNVCKTLPLGGVAVLFYYAHQRHLASAAEEQNVMSRTDVGNETNLPSVPQ